MRKLLNTLYVTSENSYLALDGENLVVYDEKKELGRLPLHNLDGIVSFGYRGTSPALMGACAERNISLCYLTPQGKFLARVTGKVQGNVLLREQQYKSSKDDEISLTIAKNCIMGKVYNARWVLERAIRDHGMQIDVEGVKKASLHLKESLQYIQNAESKDQLRGYEGEAASIYFGVFNELILQQKKEFNFQGRNKRPPNDNVNAMLSFVYTLLTNQITSALEVVGLDPYVGYLHTDRPGRVSLALDLIEELRSVYADRFVLSLINKKIVNGKNFSQKENGVVLMGDDLRKKLLVEWQNKKKEVINQIGTLTTNENGDTNEVEVTAGTVYIKELSAPKGYKLDTTVRSLKVEAGKTVTLNVSDVPKVTETLVDLFKIDMETGKATAQGNAALAGAEFTWHYYDGLYTKDSLILNPLYTIPKNRLDF